MHGDLKFEFWITYDSYFVRETPFSLRPMKNSSLSTFVL